MKRRRFASLASATTAVLVSNGAFAAPGGSFGMYGLISQLLVVPGRRHELVEILAEATRDMPGCLSYVIANDAGRDDAIWITEVWDDKDSHARSLALPGVQSAMARGRKMIAGMGTRIETLPVAGVPA